MNLKSSILNKPITREAFNLFLQSAERQQSLQDEVDFLNQIERFKCEDRAKT